jgi:hypothetical protein
MSAPRHTISRRAALAGLATRRIKRAAPPRLFKRSAAGSRYSHRLPQFDLGEPAGEWTESVVSLVRPGLVSITTATTPDISSSML